MFNPVQGQDLYKVKSQSIILPGVASDEAEYYFDVNGAVSIQQFAVVLDAQDSTLRENIEIHRTSNGGTRLYFYQYNREYPTYRHGTDSFVQINTLAYFWNVLSKNTDAFGWIRKLANPGLKIKVYGGRISNPILGDIDVSSSVLTLSDNATSYIYIDDEDNTFKSTATEPPMYFVLGKITTLSGDITSVEDYRSNYVGANIPPSITETQRNALTGVRNGVHIFNTTSGLLEFYAGGAWYPVPTSGGVDPTPRLSEVVEGKGSRATDAEFAAGTDRRGGTPLLPKPSQIKTTIIDNSSVLQNSDYLAGEDLIQGDSLFVESQDSVVSSIGVGDVEGNKIVAFPQILSNISSNQFEIYAGAKGTPTQDLYIRIEEDNSGSHSGTLVDANAVGRISKDTIKGGLDTDNITFNATDTQSASIGYRLQATADIIVTSVNKSSSCTATRAIIKTDAGVVLGTATFVGTSAIFTSPSSFSNGTYFIIELDNSGSNYTRHYLNGATFGYTGRGVKYISGSNGGATGQPYASNIDSVETIAKNTVTLLGSVSFQQEKAWFVMSQGSIGAEIVSSTNNYLYGVGKNNTTTRNVLSYSSSGLSQVYNVQNATYINKYFSTATQAGSPWNIFFSTDGTKMYVCDDNVNTVFQYTLSTAWDISTASYASKFFGIAQNATPVAMRMKSDGTKMYIAGHGSGGYVYQYTLSTAWDVSTASYDSKSFYTGTQETQPHGLFFSTDGTKMYVGGNTQAIYQYTLSTARDVSTASYASKTFSVSGQAGQQPSLSFDASGTKLFVGYYSGHSVIAYKLATAWDISTAYYDGKYNIISAVISNPRGVFVSPDGINMYIMGNTNIVYQYNMSAFSYVSSLFTNSKLLSKTSASFTYKLPDGTKLATQAYSAGELVKYDFEGISKVLSGLTPDYALYLSNLPGLLSTIPGTNIVNVGMTKSTNELLLNENVGVMYATLGLTASGTTTTQTYYFKQKSTVIGYLNTGNYGAGTPSRAYLQVSYDGITWISINDLSYGGSAYGEGMQDYFKLPVQAGTYVRVGINTNRGVAEISGYSGF